jgi:hypothetical protein
MGSSHSVVGNLAGSPGNRVTRILEVLGHGDASAAEELLPLVYDELRQLAAQRLAHERPGQKRNATALVHEASVFTAERN